MESFFFIMQSKKTNTVYRDICFDYININKYGNTMIFPTVRLWCTSSIMKKKIKN